MELLRLKTGKITLPETLLEVVIKALRRNNQGLISGDILAISSKIVSVCEKRTIRLNDVIPGPRAMKMKKSRYGHGIEDPRFIELAIKESETILPGSMLLTLTKGILIPSAGIDRSNVPEGQVVLWPKNPQKSSDNLRKTLRKKFSLKRLGIIIVDSRLQPLRKGSIGLALAWSGFKGVVDVRGAKDIYGKPLLVTTKATADNLASSATILMGEANEKIPIVIIRKAPVIFTNNQQKPASAQLKPSDCIFGGAIKLA